MAKTRIAIISDTHGEHSKLDNWLPDADMIICGGDISKFGDLITIQGFLSWFSKLEKYKTKIFIAGNHDLLFEKDRGLSRAMIFDNIIYLENSGVEIDGIYIYGSPMTPRFHDWAFNADRGEKIKKYWDGIPEETDVLITHGPPMGTLDISLFNQKTMVLDGSINHVGCEDLKNRIDEIKPKVHIFGHIHPEYGTVEKNGTLFINASSVGGNYKIKNKPFLVEFDTETKEVQLIQ